MEGLLYLIIRRCRPRVGWLLAVLAISAAVCPSLAASEGALVLPAGLIFWAGFGGMLLGLRAGRATSSVSALLFGLLALCFLAFLIVAGGQALPPFSLIWHDLSILSTALLGWFQNRPIAELPEILLWRFLSVALPRFWHEFQTAPGAGLPGAVLLITMAGILSTCVGALYLGWSIAAQRPSFIASQPLLAALALITILNGSNGKGLIIGAGLLLLLAVITAHKARERTWERLNADYSEELLWDVVGTSTLAIIAILSLAFMLPTAVPSIIMNAFWPTSELPSAIAVIDKQVQRERGGAEAEVGLSKLPSVSLGVSLQQDTPTTLALLISTGGPLPPASWPRYWRARLLTRYDGQQWSADARVAPFDQGIPGSDALPAGAVIQEVEDLRLYQNVLVAQANVIGINIAANSERLPDGALAALTRAATSGRYRVASLPPELATPIDQNMVPPPDLSASMSLPVNFSPRVRDLARSIVGQKTSAFEQALALESYLRNLPYSYTVRPTPASGDAVDYFLFEMREGYCTYYASAMVLMSRSLGIPARLAIGYATGSYDETTDSYVVREAEAHAWPELLIGGRWLPFEPTPVQPLPARQALAPILAPASSPTKPSPVVSINWMHVALLAIAVLGTGAIVIIAWYLLQRQRRGPIAQAQQLLEQIGLGAKIPWPGGATLEEYARLIEERSDGEVQALRELVRLIEQARYSNTQLDAVQLEQLKQTRQAFVAWARRNLRRK